MEATELAEAFAAHEARVEGVRLAADWDAFAGLFTGDAVYVEHAFGTFHGREQIAAWARRTMGSYPGNVMTGFPTAWHVLDPPSRRVICEIRNLMPDLGDGVDREASNITILTYAGDGLWSREEDVYNPAHFVALGVDWARAARQADRLPDDAREFLATYGGGR